VLKSRAMSYSLVDWLSNHLIITTLVLVVVAVSAALLIFQSTRTQFSAAMVGLIVTVLFSVFLNNLFALRRDRDGRMRTMRDRHLDQIRPILRLEADRLGALSIDMTRLRRLSEARTAVEARQASLERIIWPDVISPDLAHHFPDYDSAKRHLRDMVDAYDHDLEKFLAALAPRVTIAPEWNGWIDNIANTKTMECLGISLGMQLTVHDGGGYSFSYSGGSTTNSAGAPSPDQVAAYGAYQSMAVDDTISARCVKLKRDGDTVATSASKLSAQALVLAQHITLTGDCEFLPPQ
jgi:hypothetical protein